MMILESPFPRNFNILKKLKILNSFVVEGYSNILIRNNWTQKFESLPMHGNHYQELENK